MLKPTLDNIFVKPDDFEYKLKSGILLPGSAERAPETGVVLAVGPGPRNRNGEHCDMHIKPGDRILFIQYRGEYIKMDEVEYVVLRENEVLGILEE